MRSTRRAFQAKGARHLFLSPPRIGWGKLVIFSHVLTGPRCGITDGQISRSITGAMRLLGIFETSGEDRCERGRRVIARTERGLEAGEVLCEASAEAVAQLKDPHEGQILRKMTPDDAREIARIDQRRGEQLAVCQTSIDKLELSMQLVDIEQVFRRRADRGVLSGRGPRRFPRVGPHVGQRVSDANRDAAKSACATKPS